jgi:beta-glucanase (GH16 family)
MRVAQLTRKLAQLLSAVVGLIASPALAIPPGVGPVTFSDEFDGTALDTNKWMHRAPGPRNDGFNTPNAVSLGNGMLTIKTYTEAGTNFTGMIATAGLFEQTYGYFEARVRFHTTSGQWAAFWLQSLSIGNPVGDPEHAGVELDIFEHRVRDPFDGLVKPDADISDRGHQALVWDGYGPANKSKANLTPPLPGLANDTWHTWGLSWGPEGYTFFYDDTPVWVQNSPVSRRSQYIILSSEVWQKFAGPIPASGYGSLATSKTDFQVDYVRVYRNPVPDPAKNRAQPQSHIVAPGKSSTASLSRTGNPLFRIEAETNRARIPALGWDTEGGDRARINLLRPNTAIGLRLKMNGQWRGAETFQARLEKQTETEVCYRIAFLPDADLEWRIRLGPKRLTMSFTARGNGSKRVERVELEFPFAPLGAATTVLSSEWDAEAHLRLPALISAPDLGQMLLTAAPEMHLTGRLVGSRANHTVDLALELPAPRSGKTTTLTFQPVRMPAPRGLKDQSLWPAARRGWFNMFQPSAKWGDQGNRFSAPAGILANNA